MKMMIFSVLLALVGSVMVSAQANEKALSGGGSGRRLQPVQLIQYIINGDFSEGLEGWSVYVEDQVNNDITIEGGRALFKVGSSAIFWRMQLFQTISTRFASSQPYTLSADFQTRGEETRDIELVVEQNRGDNNWVTYGRSSCTIGPAVTRCSVEAVNGAAGSLKFAVMGAASEGDFFVDNVSATIGEDPPPGVTFFNGDFEEGLRGWSTYVNGRLVETSFFTSRNERALFSLGTVPAEPWYMQLYQSFDMEGVVGGRYRLSCDVFGRGEGERDIQLYMQQAESPWIEFAASDEGSCVAVRGSRTTCTLEGTVTDASLPVKIGVQAGQATGPFLVDNCEIETLN